MRRRLFLIILVAVLAYMSVSSCAVQKKAKALQQESIQMELRLAKEREKHVFDTAALNARKADTVIVKDDHGNEFFFMKAIKDEDGEMVANEVLNASYISAKFRNVAERHGKVDLEFQIVVPEAMLDSKWQVKFTPDLFTLGDSTRLESVVITGAAYRNRQLRGYERYERWLSKIVSDTTKFIDINQLEIFIARHTPELYAFKTDSTEVSEETFMLAYGISQQQAIDHYTNKFRLRSNNRRKEKKNEMFRRFVKAPIVTDGLRLDTVIRNHNGDFIYNYVQTINTRPKLRKADIVISGEVFEQETRIYIVPRTDPLTFYISSLSNFTDRTIRYRTRVVERKAEANTACYVAFDVGSDKINPDIAENRHELARVRNNIANLLENVQFDLDSIVVTANASPEGNMRYNEELSLRRSKSISKYLNDYIDSYKDSLQREKGVMIDYESGKVSGLKIERIPFVSRSAGENWQMLDKLVETDSLMLADRHQESYNLLKEIKNLDERERMMQSKPYYRHLREHVYPYLRVVSLDFHLHRKGMVKDTVHTTEIDSTYMAGVQALDDRDYASAAILLSTYKDYNTAIAYAALDRNASALEILESYPEDKRNAEINYMLALIYSRRGEIQKAVEKYMLSCRQNPSFVHRGNLDPEISILIKEYGLHNDVLE